MADSIRFVSAYGNMTTSTFETSRGITLGSVLRNFADGTTALENPKAYTVTVRGSDGVTESFTDSDLTAAAEDFIVEPGDRVVAANAKSTGSVSA